MEWRHLPHCGTATPKKRKAPPQRSGALPSFFGGAPGAHPCNPFPLPLAQMAGGNWGKDAWAATGIPLMWGGLVGGWVGLKGGVQPPPPPPRPV